MTDIVFSSTTQMCLNKSCVWARPCICTFEECLTGKAFTLLRLHELVCFKIRDWHGIVG